ncbi:hypothetical protein WR25_19912 [Diploscapter pachys]|uniref:DNA-directed RNA polymerase III subunit RPC10 n=1 Tax=Diploscapter pachys TaxID=2018661 RepID=A0A2A2LXR2_9BILA|nr:hypothetical protein WR25_19912 [Diploscapter pachys]
MNCLCSESWPIVALSPCLMEVSSAPSRCLANRVSGEWGGHEVMLSFCPDCGTILQIEEGAQCNQFSCPCCPYICPIVKKVSSKIFPKLKDLDEVLGGPSAWENAQKTEERCPICSCETAYFMQLQTRSADEPMTIFYSWFSFVLNFASLFVFLLLWVLLLLGVFLLCYQSLLHFSPNYGNIFAYISLFVTSAFLFELFYLLNEHHKQQFSGYCYFLDWVGSWKPSSCQSSNFHWIWQLNILTVAVHLIGQIIIIVSGIFGASTAAYLKSLFEGLPILLLIPSLVFIVLAIFIAIFALFGYEINLGYGFFKLQRARLPPPEKHKSPLVKRKNDGSPSRNFTETRLPNLEQKLTKIKELYLKKSRHLDFFCGWGAGCIETVILFPSNKIIFRQQLHGFSAKDAVKQLRIEGLSRLYRGLLPPLIMRTSSRALMFGLYDEFQNMLSCPHSPPNTSFTTCHAQAAFLAGMCEASLCPLERVQVLLQTSTYNMHFNNTGEAFKSLRPYGFREYYRGLSIIVARNSLSNALFFTLREPLKQKIRESGSSDSLDKHRQVVYFFSDFVSGAVLGASISTLFFPINVVKNHMQSKVGVPFENPFMVFAEIWRDRGGSIRNLYLGVHLNFTRSLLAWGITNAMYELLRRSLDTFFESKE